MLVTVAAAGITLLGQSDQAYLQWSAAEAQRIGRSFREDGRVGGALDFRIVNTDRAYNYKLRATWLTDQVIRASAHLSAVGGTGQRQRDRSIGSRSGDFIERQHRGARRD